MNLRFSKALIVTQAAAMAFSIPKAEATIRLARWFDDEFWVRVATYGLGALLTLVLAAPNTWLAYQIQDKGLKGTTLLILYHLRLRKAKT